MIAEIFGYAIVVTLLVGLAAASLEQLLAELNRPRRFAWLGAFAAALTFPPLVWLLAPAAPAPVAVTPAEPYPSTLAAYEAINWNAALVSGWAVATAVLLLLYAAAWLRLASLAKRWPHASDEEAAVVVGDDVGPAVLGVFTPRVVLPRWLIDAPAATRATVLAHELEHIAARDQLLIVAAQLVAIALPWNLPLWWFVRRLRDAIEVDCDARVLRRGVDAADYADVLLAVGEHRRAPLHVAVTLIEPVTQLERRIRIMLTRPESPSAWRVATAAAAVAALAACASQVDAPAVVTRPASAQVGTPRVDITSSRITGAGEVRVTRNSSGRVAIQAPEMTVRIPRAAELRALSEGITQTPDSIVYLGNVQLESAGTSITASRVEAQTMPDGATVLKLTDATIVGPGFDAQTLLGE